MRTLRFDSSRASRGERTRRRCNRRAAGLTGELPQAASNPSLAELKAVWAAYNPDLSASSDRSGLSESD